VDSFVAKAPELSENNSTVDYYDFTANAHVQVNVEYIDSTWIGNRIRSIAANNDSPGEQEMVDPPWVPGSSIIFASEIPGTTFPQYSGGSGVLLPGTNPPQLITLVDLNRAGRAWGKAFAPPN
jgi:hypothetical protein